MTGRWYDPLEPDDRAAYGEDPSGRSAPSPVEALLSAVVQQRGWQERLRGARVHAAWLEIAGPELARHAAPVRLHGGALVLRVASPAWATQVRYLAGELVERANAVLGAGQVQRVTVVTGRPPNADDLPTKRR